MTKTLSRPEPIDIGYCHGQQLTNGAHFAVLQTFEELESHWKAIRRSMPFVAQGTCPGPRPLYLRPLEWIFAPTRPKLVQAVMRWDEIGIKPVWYDWRSEKPEEYEHHFYERETSRRHRIEEGTWSDSDERKYCSIAKRKNRENHHGWWRLTNLPYGQSHETWFSGLLDEPSDPTQSLEDINRIFQFHTYTDWQYQSIDDVIFLDAFEMEEELDYWREECRAGRSAYGQE